MAPASEEAAAAEGGGENVEIPVELIRALNARGNLSIASASLGKILFEKVALGVNSANGKLRIHPISADFFDGGYRGDVAIDASGQVPSIAVDEKITSVSLRPMMKAMYDVDNVTGTVNGTFRLGGKGADMNAIRRDLDGTLSIELLDGAWEGTDVWYELRKARALIRGTEAPQPPSNPRTQFSSMKASGKVTNGVMQNDDFFAQLPFMQMTGKGSVNFVEATVDYTVTGRFLEKPEFVTEVSAKELEGFTKAVIPFRITGPLADPDIKPDLEKMLKERAEKEAKKALLDKVLGEEEEPPPEGEEPQEEKDVEDQLKDEAKKRLRDLLGGD
jgi:AsmA protein